MNYRLLHSSVTYVYGDKYSIDIFRINYVEIHLLTVSVYAQRVLAL